MDARGATALVLTCAFLLHAAAAGAGSGAEGSRGVELLPVQSAFLPPSSTFGSYAQCSRFCTPDLSRLRYLYKFAHVVRLNITTSTALFLPSKVQLCLYRTDIMDFCQCGEDAWMSSKDASKLELSPFKSRTLDVRAVGFTSDMPVTVFVKEELSFYRLLSFALGVALLVFAPIASAWAPLYYGTAMSVGIIALVSIVLFQLLRARARGFLAGLLLAGVGGFINAYMAEILTAMGVPEDVKILAAKLVTISIIMTGAYSGFVVVRRLCLTSSGDVDPIVATFVRWTLRAFGFVFLAQCSVDDVFVPVALAFGFLICLVRPWHLRLLLGFRWPSRSVPCNASCDRFCHKKRAKALKRKQRDAGKSKPEATAKSPDVRGRKHGRNEGIHTDFHARARWLSSGFCGMGFRQ